jgi:hypothetical protein
VKPLEVSAQQAAAVDRIARFVVRFGLTIPAILSLESMRPLSYVGSQFMHVLTPSVQALLSSQDWDALARLLEDRRGLDYLLERIEVVAAEREQGERE